MGRQSQFTQDMADKIVERLSKGEPMTSVCRALKTVTPRTVRNWMDADEAFASAIARARLDGFDAIADQCLTISDDVSTDVQRDKLRVDTRLKLLAKWDPKRYGDRLDMNLSGSVGNQTDEQLDARIATLTAKLGSVNASDGEG
jgi:hypothetical protein